MTSLPKKVTVIGLGKSGVAIAKLLARERYQVKVTEASNNAVLQIHAEELTKLGIAVELGGHRESFYRDTELMVPCPGVKPTAEPIQWAKRDRIPILGEMEVAYRYTPCPIVGITGTNGKTTVTMLIGEVLKNAGRLVKVGGNIGTPLSAFVNELTANHWVVLEISSFQLEYIEQFRPKIAVLLNFTPDHLDHHRDLNEYFEMKSKITQYQRPEDYLILNAKDKWLKSIKGKSRAQLLFFNQEKENESLNENEKAVVLIGSILGIPKQIIYETLQNFKGVEHRMEEIIVWENIRFVNDSKSTNVDSLRWALQNTLAPLHLIAGGRDKGGDFSQLNSLLKEKAKRVVLIGEAKGKLLNAWKELAIPLNQVDSLETAVVCACENSLPGTTILLSPGCASFDMFQNYEERGHQFKKIVHEMVKDVS